MKCKPLIVPPLSKALTVILLSSLYLMADGFTNMDLTTSLPPNFISISQSSLSQITPQITNIGDFNGDGIDDAIISDTARTESGAVYVIFGKKNPSENIDIDNVLSTGQGFVIYGPASPERFTGRISNAGDINDDGFNDIIMFTIQKSAYVIFGQRNSGSVNIASLTPSQGFRIYLPLQTASETGQLEVTKAGDFNNDGFDDIIISVSSSSPLSRTNAGTVYIIFGQQSVFPSIGINLNSIPGGVQTFKIFGAKANDQLGYSISSAGDFNGDGIDDIIIATGQWDTYGDKFYIIYGHTGTFIDLDLAGLISSQGFKIASDNGGGENGPWTVANAGDFNNDGINDVVVGVGMISSRDGSRLGVAYVIFGKNGGLSNTDLSALDQTQRYAIMASSYYRGPCFASTAADLNGDGISDIAFGLSYTNEFKVIYGRSDGVPSMSVDFPKANEGFTIKSSASSCVDIDIVGDFDSDGKNDIISPGGSAAYIILGGEKSNSNATTRGAIIGGVVAGVLCIILAIVAYCYFKRIRDRKRKEAEHKKQAEKEDINQISKQDQPNPPAVPIAPPEPCGEDSPINPKGQPEAHNQPDVAIPVAPGHVDYAPKMSKEEAEAQNRSKFKAAVPLDQAIEHAKKERLDNYEQQQAIDPQNMNKQDEPIALDQAIEIAIQEGGAPVDDPPGESVTLKMADEVRAELEQQR